MNYGKRSTSKKRNALISRTSMLEKRAHVSFIRVLFTALIAVCVMVVCLGIGSFRGVIAGAPDVNTVMFIKTLILNGYHCMLQTDRDLVQGDWKTVGCRG